MSLEGSGLQAVQALISAVLLAASALCLPLAYVRAREQLSGTSRLAFGGAWAAGALGRVFTPAAPAMVFIGYRMTEQAATLLPLAHYGASASAFYHLIFAVAPVDHAVIMSVNAVVGTLAIPFVAAFAARWCSDPRAGVFAAWLLAIIPLFVRNDCSEANNVPTLWWLFGALVLLASWADSGRRRDLLAAVPLFALACTARPEVLLYALPLAAFCLAIAPEARRLLRDPRLWLALLVVAALCVPHVSHVLRELAALDQEKRLPGYDLVELKNLSGYLVQRNTLLRVELFPVAALVCALGLLVLPSRGGRLRALALALLALFTAAVYMIDLDEANMARAHVPAAILVSVLAAGGLAAVSRLRRGILWGAIGFAAIGATALPTAYRLFAPTNEATEDALIRDAAEAMPEAPFIIVRPHYADRRERPNSFGGITHYHFPDYLFLPPARLGSPRSMTDFLAEPTYDPPTFFYRGLRCYAVLRGPHDPPPGGRDEHPLCARMVDEFQLDPVFETKATNYGDLWIPYYPASPTLTVGLYRVSGPAPPPPERESEPEPDSEPEPEP